MESTVSKPPYSFYEAVNLSRVHANLIGEPIGADTPELLIDKVIACPYDKEQHSDFMSRLDGTNVYELLNEYSKKTRKFNVLIISRMFNGTTVETIYLDKFLELSKGRY